MRSINTVILLTMVTPSEAKELGANHGHLAMRSSLLSVPPIHSVAGAGVSALHQNSYRPPLHRESSMADRHKDLRCAVRVQPITSIDLDSRSSSTSARDLDSRSASKDLDPNLTPGAAKKLTYQDKMNIPGFNEVQVRVYNIDRYGMSPLAAKALNKNIEAIWHVGVAVFGKEYWYGAIVESQNLAEVDYAYGFGPSHVYNIGTTNVDPEEFHNWVMNVKANEYVVDTYDCFTHNCHHFANELVMKLTGKTPQDGGFPAWCLEHGENALSNVGEAKADRIRWVSNRIAKVMMLSWGKYNKDRFVKNQESEALKQPVLFSQVLPHTSSTIVAALLCFFIATGAIFVAFRFHCRRTTVSEEPFLHTWNTCE